ncbi:hypothetical protein BJ742DRAFT_771618 [Cladochytrium replicatum]|nr:hypothetical protein BJ742DRAFT_771618 [Cladochytrium replicatum]
MTDQSYGGKLTTAQMQSLQPIIQTSSALSFVGSAFIIISYIFVPSFRRPSNRLVFYMSFADLFGSLGLFFANWPVTLFKNREFCIAQGIWVNTFMLSAMLWTACLSVQVLLATRKGSNVASLQASEKYFHAASWGIPVILSLVAYFLKHDGKGDVYGDATLWCWITGPYADYRLYFFYIWLWAIFLWNLGVYFFVGYVVMSSQRRIHKMSSERPGAMFAPSTAMKNYIRKTSFFILAFFINWFWGSVNRIQGFFDPNTQIYALFVLHAVFTPLQGFLNFLAYFLVHYFFKKSKSSDGTGEGSTGNGSSPGRSGRSGTYKISYSATGSKLANISITPSYDSPAYAGPYSSPARTPTTTSSPGGNNRTNHLQFQLPNPTISNEGNGVLGTNTNTWNSSQPSQPSQQQYLNGVLGTNTNSWNSSQPSQPQHHQSLQQPSNSISASLWATSGNRGQTEVPYTQNAPIGGYYGANQQTSPMNSKFSGGNGF